jgi:hypothetical protein
VKQSKLHQERKRKHRSTSNPQGITTTGKEKDNHCGLSNKNNYCELFQLNKQVYLRKYNHFGLYNRNNHFGLFLST